MTRWSPGRFCLTLLGLALGGILLDVSAALAQNGFHSLYSPDGTDVWVFLGKSGKRYVRFTIVQYLLRERRQRPDDKNVGECSADTHQPVSQFFGDNRP